MNDGLSGAKLRWSRDSTNHSHEYTRKGERIRFGRLLSVWHRLDNVSTVERRPTMQQSELKE